MKIPKVSGSAEKRTIYIEQNEGEDDLDYAYIELTPEMVGALVGALFVAGCVVASGIDFPMPETPKQTKQ